ncbi:MAG TPA: hypothetical protein VMZ92_04990 [Planctomycetota bacterium]|nr:hypothetical protein [Planctomycetota bacterium]
MPLPSTKLGDLMVTRLVVGGNPVSGFSHGARDKEMRDYFTTENTKKLLARCEAAGINTCFFRADKHVMRLLTEYWNDGGTIQWVAQSAPEIEVVRNVDAVAAYGAKAIYIHGGLVDSCFESGDFDPAKRQLDRIHEHGIAAGCASHNPRNILKLLEMGWDIDFFMVCLYHLEGYRGKLSVSQDEKFNDADRAKALAIFKQIEQPCFAYKILAAGRKDPREAFTEVCSKIKPIDGINVGIYPPDSPTIVEDNVRLAEELLPR